ncbi:hypothetical protein [Bryobacter aggregatus]|uniref:hypothetical protein n=1 Tax=Bryobacter aggregatus TaxID=360054 RepID=UPI0004E10BD9|nr:hypothetical protein [Bryobacter aggregatus]
MIPKPVVNKAQYTEAEAAAQLGVSVDDLRNLIRRHIVVDEVDATNVPMTTFQPSDLLVLRLLSKSSLSQVA